MGKRPPYRRINPTQQQTNRNFTAHSNSTKQQFSNVKFEPTPTFHFNSLNKTLHVTRKFREHTFLQKNCNTPFDTAFQHQKAVEATI